MPWLVYVLIAVVLMSFSSLIVKKLMKNVNQLIILFYQCLIAVPLVIIYSYFSSGALITINNYPLILLGVIYVTAIALYYVALSNGPLSKVSPVFNLKMIVTAVLGLIILIEPLTIQLILGLVFGMLGIYLLGGERE